jgi:hypothetical protein
MIHASALKIDVKPSSTHKGVHEQFYAVVAAIEAYEALRFGGNQFLANSLRSHHKKIIKSVIKDCLAAHGQKSGFLTTGLAYYAYEFWEVIIEHHLGNSPTHEQVIDFSKQKIQDLADALDSQFSKESMADSIGFLKSLL